MFEIILYHFQTVFGDILEMDIELFRSAVEKVKEYFKKLKDAAANKTEKPEDSAEGKFPVFIICHFLFIN